MYKCSSIDPLTNHSFTYSRRARHQQRQIQVVGGRDGLHIRRIGRLLNKSPSQLLRLHCILLLLELPTAEQPL